MSRRPRESRAVGHTTPPIVVNTMDPIADHPSLGPLRDARRKKVVAKSARGKSKVQVAVKVEHNAG